MRCLFAVPGDIDTPTGGYAYARKVLQYWPADAPPIEHVALPGGFPFPSEADLRAAGDALLAARAGGETVALIDGLAFGAFTAELLARLGMPIVALVHHPLGLETGLSPETAASLIASERRALASTLHVVTSSHATSRTLQSLMHVPEQRITVAEPGIDRALRGTGARAGEPLNVVSAGAVTPRKGFCVLVDALHRVRDLDWRATIAGALDRDPAEAARVLARVRELDLGHRVHFAGALADEALSALYGSGDIFALATHYEGYGMVFSEAMARGLPIVCSGAGAVSDTVPPNAGLHVPAGDVGAFADALRRMISDEEFRWRCAQAAYTHAQTLPGWDQTARNVAGAISLVRA